MSWFSDHALHLVLIGVYLAILARHGWVGRRNVHSIDDYLVAGRRMGGLVIALSYYATFMSTNTFIGAAGKSWDVGLIWCGSGIVLTAMACLSWIFVAPRFVPLTREYNSLTVADFLGSHYQSERVRQVAAAIIAFSSVLYLVAIYRGAALALGSFLDVSYAWCVFAVLIIVTAYTLLGGFESVVLTDALQGVLMLVGAIVLVLAIIQSGGGLPSMLDSLRDQDPKLVSLSHADGLSPTLAYALAVGVKFLVEPRQLSRYYGLKDAKALRRASVVAPVAIFLTYLCLLPIGALARTILPLDAIQETDQVVPHLLGEAEVLGSVVGTMFLLVLVSAAMSSIDSVLLVVASTIDRDLFARSDARRSNSDRSNSGHGSGSPQRTRMWVVVVSVVAALTALSPYTHDIVQLTAFSGSLYGACFLPVLVVGLFMTRRSPRAALMTMGVGTCVTILAFVLRKLEVTTVHEVYPGILIGITVFGVFSWTRRSERGRNA